MSEQLQFRDFDAPNLKDIQFLVQQMIHDDHLLGKLPINLRLLSIIYRLYHQRSTLHEQDESEQLIHEDFDYLEAINEFFRKTDNILETFRQRDIPFIKKYFSKLDFSILDHSCLLVFISALTLKQQFTEEEIDSLTTSIQACIGGDNNKSLDDIESSKDFQDFKTGVRLLKLLPKTVVGSYIQLITNPRQIYEQMLLNREEEALQQASKFVKYDDLLEKNMHMTQNDAIKTLINNSCNDYLISITSSDSLTPIKLLEKLLEAEYFDLALEVATKLSLDTTGIWRTWAMQCLKNGYLNEAREKFRRCFTRARYSTETIKSVQSKLLGDIIVTISNLDERKLSLQQQIKMIKQGVPIKSDHNYNSQLMLKPSLYNECLYYLELFGSVVDKIQFYVTYCMWDKPISFIIKNEECEKVKLYKLLNRALARNTCSNIVQDFKLLYDRIKDDLEGYISNISVHSDVMNIDNVCDSIVIDFINSIREQDYQTEIAKLLVSPEAKIEFYIKLGKLSNAQRIACSSNKVKYVKRIIDEAIRLKQTHVRTVCQLWLAKHDANI